MSAAKWSVQEAKNRFSAVLRAARAGEPQVVTNRGEPAAVVLSFEEYQRLRDAEFLAAPSFKDMLLAIPKGDETFERDRGEALREVDL